MHESMIRSISLHVMVAMGNQQITFDKQIWTQKGFLLGMKTKSQLNKAALLASCDGPVLIINLLHTLLGHTNKAYTRATAKQYGWQVQSSLNV
jgi:hypothetical protein